MAARLPGAKDARLLSPRASFCALGHLRRLISAIAPAECQQRESASQPRRLEQYFRANRKCIPHRRNFSMTAARRERAPDRQFRSDGCSSSPASCRSSR